MNMFEAVGNMLEEAFKMSATHTAEELIASGDVVLKATPTSNNDFRLTGYKR